MHSSAPAVISRTRGALLLSCTKASVRRVRRSLETTRERGAHASAFTNGSGRVAASSPTDAVVLTRILGTPTQRLRLPGMRSETASAWLRPAATAGDPCVRYCRAPGPRDPRPEVEAGGYGGAALRVAQRLRARHWRGLRAVRGRDPDRRTVPPSANSSRGHYVFGGSRGAFGSSGRTTIDARSPRRRHSRSYAGLPAFQPAVPLSSPS